MTAKNRLIVYVSDRGFMVPTMRSVVKLAESEGVTSVADIRVYLLNISDAEAETLRRDFSDIPVTFETMDARQMVPDGVVFHKTHVPVSTLARFHISGIIPEQYEHIIYIDGDTIAAGDVLPLITHDVAEGKLAAGSDAMWLYEGNAGAYWKWARSYLDGIGVADPKDYFNAGVLAFRRSTWEWLAPRALEYFLANSEKCHYHDQSALNAVCVGIREVLAPQWNFISNYADLGTDLVDPRLIHFTGGGKPWFYDGPPWNGRFTGGYADLIESRPSLSAFIRSPSPEDLARFRRVEGRRRLRTSLVTPWRTPLRRARFAAYCRDTAFDL